VQLYKEYFTKFLEYTGKTADQLIEERIIESRSEDMKIKRRAESQFKSFLAVMKNFYKPKTMQNIYASIRSFYEIHYYLLIMRKSDYPKGEGIGQLRATREALQKIMSKASIPMKALITTANDTGMGVSDLKHLKCRIILENPTATLIHIRAIRQKTGDKIHTFLGEESIKALKNYLALRESGTSIVPPETITNETPLFRTWQAKQVKQPSRTNLSSLLSQAFKRAGYQHMSAHSLRKKLQTNLEKSGMPTNWIDLVLGHQLINSRDAYSLPTDEELQQCYEKAYNDHIAIFPKEHKTEPQTQQIIQNLNIEQLRQLLITVLSQPLKKT
jgi:integrase